MSKFVRNIVETKNFIEPYRYGKSLVNTDQIIAISPLHHRSDILRLEMTDTGYYMVYADDLKQTLNTDDRERLELFLDEL